jgi:AbrB family looped-hinge helix DNA binding protein
MVFAIINGMKLLIDRSGRIVVPKRLREWLGFLPDTEIEVVEEPGGLLLRPSLEKPSMVKVDGFWVHQGAAEAGANWDRVVGDVREERIQSVLKA